MNATITTAQDIAEAANRIGLVPQIEAVLKNAAAYTVINDGDVRYAVETEKLTKWEAANGDISGDKYDEFCSAVPYVMKDLGTPGNIGQIELYAALRELGADVRSF